jgi:hypothetical protein
MCNDAKIISSLRASLVLIAETAKMQMDDVQREAPIFTRRISHADDQKLFTHIHEYAVKAIAKSNGISS